LLSGPLSHPTDTSDISILHVGTATGAGTHIDKFWDVEFTGILSTAESTIVSDQQLLTTDINSSVSQGLDGPYIVNIKSERHMRSLACKLARTPKLYILRISD